MTASGFALDPRLEGSTHHLADLPLCRAGLQDDARFPWIVLVPRRVGAVELEDLSMADRVTLLGEIDRAAAGVRALGAARGRPVEKLNIAALGNQVRQLHVHVIGRRADDAAGLSAVWGAGAREPWGEAAAEAIAAARAGLGA